MFSSSNSEMGSKAKIKEKKKLYDDEDDDSYLNATDFKGFKETEMRKDMANAALNRKSSISDESSAVKGKSFFFL